MSSNVAHQLTVAIGAALSGSFTSVTSDATSKISKIGAAIKDMEKQSVLSAGTVDKLKSRYNSFLGSMNKQQEILQKRAFYQSQILGIVAMGAALAAPIKAAKEFNSHLSKFKRMYDFKEPGGHRKLGDMLLNMSLKLPVTTDNLGKLAVAGARFGVALEDLPKYVEDTAKASRVWNMEADELGEKMGNFMKVFGVGAKDVSKYFDAITALGRTSGTEANEVLRSVVRAAGGTANFKLSIPQIAALTTTIMSFGEGSEQAGTLVTGMLKKLSAAPRASVLAQKTLRDVGLTIENIPDMINKNPQEVLNKLFEGVSKLSAAQRELALREIFGRGPSVVVGKLINNLDLYKKNMDKANNATGIFDEDWEKVKKGTTSALILLDNNIGLLGKQIGLVLLPTIKQLAIGLVDLIQPVTDFMSKNKELTSVVVHAVAGFMSFRIATFALGYASTFLFGGWNRLIIGAKGLRLALGLLGAGMKTLLFGGFGAAALAIGGLSLATSGFRKEAVGGLAADLGIVGAELEEVTATASEGLAPAFKVLGKHTEKISEVVGKRFAPELRALEKTFEPVSKKLAPVFDNISAKFEKELLPHFDTFKDRLNAVAVGVAVVLVPALENFRKVFGGIIKDIRSGAIPVIEALRGIFAGISAGEIGGMIAGIGLLGGSFWLIAKTIMPAVSLVFKGLGKVLWSLAKNVIPLVFSGISLAGRSFWFLVSSVFPLLYSGFKELAGQAWRVANYLAPKIWSGVTWLAGGFWNLAKSAVNGLIPALKSLKTVSGALKFTALIGAAYLIYENWDLIAETFNNFINSDFGQKIVAIWNGIVAQVTSTHETWVQILNHPIVENWGKKFSEGADIVGSALKTVGEMFVTLWNVTKNLGLVLWEVGKAFVFISDTALDAYYSIEGKWTALKTFFTTIWEPVKPHWESFLKEIQELNIADKIMASWQKLKIFFTGIWDDITPNWDKFVSPLSKLWSNVKAEVPAVGRLFTPDETKPSLTSKLLPLSGAKAASVTKNQSNVFNINVNASKISDPREIAKRVSEEMKSFNWNYLYDPIGAMP